MSTRRTTVMNLASGLCRYVEEEPRRALLRAYAEALFDQNADLWEVRYGHQVQKCSLGTLVLGDYAVRLTSGRAAFQSHKKPAAVSELLKQPSADPLLEVVKEFISTIESTGGVVQLRSGLCAPAADEDWIDLGEVYVKAKEALGEPVEMGGAS